MNVSPLGISSARLPVPVGRSIAVPDEVAPVRKSKEGAVPAERVYVGEYVAAGSNAKSAYLSRDEYFAARQYGSSPGTGGNRRFMVQAYVQNAAVSSSGGRASGRIDYFA